MSRNALGEIASILASVAAASGPVERQGSLASVLGSYDLLDTARLSVDLKFEWRRLQPGGETEIHGCVLGPPIDFAAPVLFPVFMLGLKKPAAGDSVSCWIRVALYAEGHDPEGWRFELADQKPDDAADANSPRAHFYVHAQRIVGWRRGQTGFAFYPDPAQTTLAAAEDADMFQRRPAFPLPAESPAGLVVAAVVSLYGSVQTRDMMENYTPKPPDIAQEIRRLTGL